jgi:hypothetical protein
VVSDESLAQFATMNNDVSTCGSLLSFSIYTCPLIDTARRWSMLDASVEKRRRAALNFCTSAMIEMHPTSFASVLVHQRVAPNNVLPLSSRRHLHLLIRLHIDIRLCPLTSWDTTLEQYVNLAIGSTFHLRQEEVCRYQAAQPGSTPDIAALASKISALHCVSNRDRRW